MSTVSREGPGMQGSVVSKDPFFLPEKWIDTERLVTECLKNCSQVRRKCILGIPGGPMVKNSPAKAGDMGSIPGLGRSHMLWSN